MKIKDIIEKLEPWKDKVQINSPGNKHHGRIATVFHDHGDGRINAQIRNSHKKGDVTNLTLNPNEFKKLTDISYKEAIELDESVMAEIHQSLQDHLDKHINKFNKKLLGHDQFGEHCIKAAHKIAKQHGIEHKHAQKFVNDYVDSKLG